MTRMAELQEVIVKKRPGDKLSLTYMRDKKKHTVEVTLKNEQGNVKVVKNVELDVLGANFMPLSDAKKAQMGLSYGLEVIKVNAGKVREAGIGRGFIIQKVNSKPVKAIEDLQEIVKEASVSKEPVLYIQGVYPTGKRGYYALPLTD